MIDIKGITKSFGSLQVQAKLHCYRLWAHLIALIVVR